MDSHLIESVDEATDVSLDPLARFWLKTDNFLHRLRQAARRRADRSHLVNSNFKLQHLIYTNRSCLAAVLSRRAAVFLVPIGGARPLWMVEALSSRFPEERAVFFLLAYWSLETAPGV